MEYKLFVGNIPFDCTKLEFKNLFKKYKGLKSADLINDNNKCFGFVIFDNIEIIENILQSNNIHIRDRKLRLTRYNNKTKETTNYIRLKNIHDTITCEDIRIEFENYSEIGKCFIDMDRITGKYKNTGIVEIIDTQIYEQLLGLDVILINDHQINIEKYINPTIQNNNNNDNKEKKYNKLNF